MRKNTASFPSSRKIGTGKRGFSGIIVFTDTMYRAEIG
jgi:hypothetical protein